jgi:hypothetical protein
MQSGSCSAPTVNVPPPDAAAVVVAVFAALVLAVVPAAVVAAPADVVAPLLGGVFVVTADLLLPHAVAMSDTPSNTAAARAILVLFNSSS